MIIYGGVMRPGRECYVMTHYERQEAVKNTGRVCCGKCHEDDVSVDNIVSVEHFCFYG